MRNIYKIFFIFLLINIFTQNIILANKSTINKTDTISNFVFTNKTYKNSIHTVIIHKMGWQLSFPIIDINNEDEIISLSFDELASNINDYSWVIIHCNSDWTKSELDPIDYIDGFNEGSIQNYSLSKNTTINYVNYKLSLPNDDASFEKSGNYIIKIFEQNDSSQVVLTRKFYVIDKKTNIEGSIFKKPLLNNSNNQGVNFEITYNEDIIDAYTNLKTFIIKNGELSMNTQSITPSKVGIHKISYEHINNLRFPGGNEFRHFDIKSLRFLSDNIKTINYKNNNYQVVLQACEIKFGNEYNFKNDLNGKCLIELENSSRSFIEADYCKVVFTLKAPININKGNYYIFGALSDWQTSEKYRMSFDEVKQEYTLSLLLKQGYYNYQCIFKSEGLSIDETSQWLSVEGNNYQTENDYYLLTYYKNPIEQFEELVGFTKINSNN